jgi:tetratricopeptide (TPR) repeat protein
MKRILTCLFLILLQLPCYISTFATAVKQDTTEVINLNISGFDMRLSDARQTIRYANKALVLAKKINYVRGIANAYRVRGLGENYLGNSERAIENYFQSLDNYQRIKDFVGEVRIYLNISSLYQEVDQDKCLEYLNNAMLLYNRQNMHNNSLLASIYLNFGNVYQLKSNYNKALANYNQSFQLVKNLNNKPLTITVLQNLGVIYAATGRANEAKINLFKALEQARGIDLNQPVAQINLTLSDIYIAEGNYAQAEASLREGNAYAILAKSDKLQHSFKVNLYMLELKRNNFENALKYLQIIYKQDSIDYSSRNSAALSLYQAKYKQEDLRRKNEQITLKQKYDRVKLVGTIILAAFLVVVIVLLTGNVKRKAETNKKLTELNSEISTQKDNLDRINHHLEEIIDDRTKDLQMKNKKLSEYSSHLSHQIRGPIATLKGLMNLEQEGLVSEKECIQMMIKCVSEIDDKIIDMSDMLHNPERAGL